MNTSAALRLLAAANDDAVLASWAAVFDEHKMAPECDVSPYDCWEVLQEFLSSGVLSPFEYNSVDMKKAFFNGSRPTTGEIQDVLNRLRYLRSHQDLKQENPVSNARPPMSAFSNESALVTNKESTGLPAGPRHAALAGQRPNPGLAAFQPRQESFAPPPTFQAFADPQRRESLAMAQEQRQDPLTCRKVDAKMYQGMNGQIDVRITCASGHPPMEIEILSDDEDIIDGDEMGDAEYAMHEYMFHGECKACGALFHNSMSRPIPKANY